MLKARDRFTGNWDAPLGFPNSLLPESRSERPISELVGLPLVGTGSWLGRDNCGLFATPDALAFHVNPQTGETILVISDTKSAAVVTFDDDSAKRPNIVHEPQRGSPKPTK